MTKKKTSTKSTKTTRHRDAASGQFVKKEYADKHPKTTVKESDKDKGKDKGTDHTGPRRK
jgi:hypothetical protein